jgi:hypothetical protein
MLFTSVLCETKNFKIATIADGAFKDGMNLQKVGCHKSAQLMLCTLAVHRMFVRVSINFERDAYHVYLVRFLTTTCRSCNSWVL